MRQNAKIFQDFSASGAIKFAVEKYGTFIVFKDSQTAQAALNLLHNREYDGFKLRLTYAGFFVDRGKKKEKTGKEIVYNLNFKTYRKKRSLAT